jgi:hypothetical protein
MRFLVLLFLVACGGASYQTIKMTNRSPHAIASIYIYPAGSQNHGSSRGALAPNASIEVKVKSGNVDVLAVTVKEEIADGKRESKEAQQTLELREPIELIFHDSTQAITTTANTIGVMFRVIPTEEKTNVEDPVPAP